MAKEAIIQVRMDQDLKDKADKLYKSMGTSFSEAIRVFAAQSVMEQGYPFIPRIYNVKRSSQKGCLSQYASVELRKKEKLAFREAMVNKHE